MRKPIILLVLWLQVSSACPGGQACSTEALHQAYLAAYREYTLAVSNGAPLPEIEAKFNAYFTAYSAYSQCPIPGSTATETNVFRNPSESSTGGTPSSADPSGSSSSALGKTLDGWRRNTSKFLWTHAPMILDSWNFLQAKLPSQAVKARNHTGRVLSSPVRSFRNVKTGHTLLYSNIFESVIKPGILFSTLDKSGMNDANAHLQGVFEGRPGAPASFDFFSHHRLGTVETDEKGNKHKLEFKGKVVTLMFNPGSTSTSVNIQQNVTSSMSERGYAQGGGPGDLTASRIMRGTNTDRVGSLVIPPGEFRVVNQWGGGFCETHNTQIAGRVETGKMQLVEIAIPDGVDLSKMGQAEIKAFIAGQKLHPFSPTDHPYVASGKTKEMIGLDGKTRAVEIPTFMGRGGGISSQGAIAATAETFDVAKESEASYAVNTTPHKSFGTNQMQSTAFDRFYDHKVADAKTGLVGTVSSPYNFGNYGVRQTYSVPVTNSGRQAESISLVLGCPTFNEGNKDKPGFRMATTEETRKNGLPSYYLRTEAVVSWTDASGKEQSRIVRINQTAGQMSELLRISLNPGEASTLEVRMLGTGDSTPNQVLSVMKTSSLGK